MAIKLRGDTTMGMLNEGIAKRNQPIILRNSTETYSTNQPSQPLIGGSYNKMFGQNEPSISKFTGMLPSANQFSEQPNKSGFYSSMAGLEAASMRFADAESKRGIAAKSAESEMSAKAAGFRSADEMSRYNRMKREESDKEEKEAKYEKKMIADGYVKSGGRWVRKMA